MPADPRPIDDGTLDALIEGRDVPDGARHLASFVAGCRAAGDGDPPPPSPALAQLLRGDDAADTRPRPTVVGARRARPARGARRVHRRPGVLGRIAGVGLAVKIVLGAGVAAAGVAGAGALHVLPGAPGEAVRKAIDATTPFELDEPSPIPTPVEATTADDPAAEGRTGGTEANPTDTGPAATATDAADPGSPAPQAPADAPGATVSDDATGESDGVPGVDGPATAEAAPGADNRPEGAGPGGTPPGQGAGGTPGPPAGTAPPDHAGPPAGKG